MPVAMSLALVGQTFKSIFNAKLEGIQLSSDQTQPCLVVFTYGIKNPTQLYSGIVVSYRKYPIA